MIATTISSHLDTFLRRGARSLIIGVFSDAAATRRSCSFFATFAGGCSSRHQIWIVCCA